MAVQLDPIVDIADGGSGEAGGVLGGVSLSSPSRARMAVHGDHDGNDDGGPLGVRMAAIPTSPSICFLRLKTPAQFEPPANTERRLKEFHQQQQQGAHIPIAGFGVPVPPNATGGASDLLSSPSQQSPAAAELQKELRIDTRAANIHPNAPPPLISPPEIGVASTFSVEAFAGYDIGAKPFLGGHALGKKAARKHEKGQREASPPPLTLVQTKAVIGGGEHEAGGRVC